MAFNDLYQEYKLWANSYECTPADWDELRELTALKEWIRDYHEELWADFLRYYDEN